MHDLTTLITHWQEPPALTYDLTKALTQDVIFLQITTLNSDHLSWTADISALAGQYTAQTADQNEYSFLTHQMIVHYWDVPATIMHFPLMKISSSKIS